MVFKKIGSDYRLPTDKNDKSPAANLSLSCLAMAIERPGRSYCFIRDSIRCTAKENCVGVRSCAEPGTNSAGMTLSLDVGDGLRAMNALDLKDRD